MARPRGGSSFNGACDACHLLSHSGLVVSLGPLRIQPRDMRGAARSRMAVISRRKTSAGEAADGCQHVVCPTTLSAS